MPAINSPFRYAGGKFYARKLIVRQMPAHSYYVEPFCGGASIFFAKDKVESWLNDIDQELINTLIIIRDRPEELIESLKGIEAKKELHGYFKNEFKPRDELERAKRWFYLNRTSYSGIMNMQNCFWGYGDKYSMRPENWPRNIRRTSEKLQGVKLTSLEFAEVIKQAPDGAFMFVDPPYYNADQDKFYTHSFTKEDHHKVMECLKENSPRFKFLLTYDNTPEVRELYNWAEEIVEEEWNYTISRTDDQKKGGDKTTKGARSKGREIFILNYASPLSAQQPLRLDVENGDLITGSGLTPVLAD